MENFDLDSLIAQLQKVRAEVGQNLPINISVWNDTPSVGSYEDRKLAASVEVVKGDNSAFVELYV